MKILSPKVLIILTCMLLSTAKINAETFTHGYVHFPPFFNNQAEFEETGSWGSGNEAMDAIYKKAGLDVKFVDVPMARAMGYIQKGAYTFHNIGPGLEEFLIYPLPGTILNVSAIVRKGTTNVPKTVEEFEAIGII